MDAAADPRWPRVSVTMLTHHSPGTSVRALRSVLESGYAGPLEVLVREQGGDDAEFAALCDVAATEPSVCVERGENLGFCDGHERLLARATGEILVLLNDDALLAPGFLDNVVAAFDDPGVGSVQGLLVSSADPRRIDTAGLEVDRSRRVAARLRGRPVHEAPTGSIDVWGADGAVLVLRRSAVDDARGPDGRLFPAEFGAYMEDVELAWRLRRLGWRCRFVPAAVAEHGRGTAEDHRGLWARVVARRQRPAAAHVGGFVNLRLAQVRHEQPGRLLRDVHRFLPREVAAWVALVVVTPASVPSVLRRLAGGIGPSWRARRSFRARVRAVDDHHWFR